MAMNCEIELLSPRLLEDYPSYVGEMDDLRLNLGLDIGWHYPLDIIWILRKITLVPESKIILDAGAGKGLLQFLMAERGHQVVSVDFSDRRMQLPIRLAYPIQILKGDTSSGEYLGHMNLKYTHESPAITNHLVTLRRGAYKIRRFLTALFRLPSFFYRRRRQKAKVGSILIYWSNILNMHLLEDASVDIIVSLSAIEHMKKSEIEKVLGEFKRVLKPGGALIITTNAAKDHDWYHEPSMGWCFSEQFLHQSFGLNKNCTSNWDEYKSIQEEIRSSVELQRRLSPSYKLSGKNGMPWGIWNPQYVPVGVFIEMS
jgi:ubiquinone/menaquinone biosynthesis C-methylase UbiE